MLKINNIPFKDFRLSDEGENIIFAKDFNEEFFGIYNVNVLEKKILCESKNTNYVSCEVVYNNNTYKNVSFKIRKSDSEKIILNEKLLHKMLSENKSSNINAINIIEESNKKQNNLSEFEERIIEEKADIIRYYNNLEKEIFMLKQNKKSLEKNVSILEEKYMKGMEAKNIFEEIEKYKKELFEEFISLNNKNELIINEKFKNIQNLIENKLETQILEEKTNVVYDKKEIIKEKDELKEINKKVENFDTQLLNLVKDKKNTQTLIQNIKNYTDLKVAQALEESKKFTRLMMDFVGGGGGGVAVQYAGGGTVKGDLVVEGDLTANLDLDDITVQNITVNQDINVAGAISATTILSGSTNIADIFAGEGEGDTNALDGGFV
jgi:hypothetical protein